MKRSIYSIYDNVAEVFNKPFTEINDGSAIRAFTMSVVNEVHKNDYVLFKLAEFNDTSGDIKGMLPQKLITGFEVKNEGTSEVSKLLEEQSA